MESAQPASRCPNAKRRSCTQASQHFEKRYNVHMAREVIHISEAEAARDFLSLLSRVRAGADVIIERDAQPVAIVHPAGPERRTISECIARLPEDSKAVMDPEFARDVEAAIESHREPLNPPSWD